MKTSELGTDLFGLYKSEVEHLLSLDDDVLPFPNQDSGCNGMIPSSSTKTNGENKVHLFSNAIQSSLSEFKRERLVSLLRQSAFDFTREIEEEMAHPVLSGYQILSAVRRKKGLSDSDESAHEAGDAQDSMRKTETSLPCSNSEDLDTILSHEPTQVEQLIGKHNRDLADLLLYVEQNLEELLNTVMTTCRPMNMAEKEELCKSISKLSPVKLDSIMQILRKNKPANHISNEVFFNLDEEDDVTLWRLYFYLNASDQHS